MKAKTLAFFLIGLFFLGAPVSALADNYFIFEYGFTNVTNNDADDAAIGEAQLYMWVEDLGNGQVSFLFGNEGDEASSIADIYFDDSDPLLLDYLSTVITNSSGVSFSEGAKPSNLPGGGSFEADYSADSDSPVQPNGVNPGETVLFTFDMNDGYDYDDLIAVLDENALSVGLHVQGFDSGGSEGFISTGPGDPVPEPATMLLFGTGMACLAGYRRRNK